MSSTRGQGLQWTKLLGFLMVAFAIWLALDPDYPVPRGRMHAPSGPSSRPASAMARPEPLAPRAAVARAGLTFRWHWPGAGAEMWVVVFDDALAQVVAIRSTTGLSATPDEQSLALLPAGMTGHWLVEARLPGGTVRSVPVPFALLD